MISLILSILGGAISSISNFIGWIRDQQLVDLGSKAQAAQSLQDEDTDDTKITQIRDEAFHNFDHAASLNRLPDDSQLRK